MGDGRVTDIRPRTLKRIRFYETDQDGKKYPKNTFDERIKFLDEGELPKEGIKLNSPKDDIKNIFAIPTNNKQHSKLYFTKKENSEKIPHIDGIVIDNKTGNLRYFIAKEDVVGKGMLEKIIEGSRVNFTDEPQGVCEIILHKRDENNNIVGDIDLSDDIIPAVVEFVEISSVKEYPESLPTFRPLEL